MRSFYTFLLLCFSIGVSAQVHTSYLWHLQQPIYWPEQSTWNQYHYQTVWESQYLKDNNGNWYSDGMQHPLNNLTEIFGNDDRKAVYQFRAKDAVQSLLGHPEAGAQVNYGGCLMENVNSLAQAGQLGYYSTWNQEFQTARNWQTSGGNPRMDLTGFTMHHALSPLISENVLRKQIQAHKITYANFFGTSPNYSKGYWPAECSFSERIIKALVEEGFEWSIIANSHLARTLNDYPLTYGTNGCNVDRPNQADIVSTNGNNWWSGQIDGRGGQFAAPFCYQAHKAKYVDPETGQEYKIDVVPMADLLSYQNGYSTMGTGEIDVNIAPYNDNNQPSIVLMAHDGDNAWGGGYDYYQNSVPGLANAAANQGYVPTTIQQFLDDHPVPQNDIVHVEDGSWFNAANDWGHPQFINWLWPMYDSNYNFDPNGWTEDARNWAVLTAAENHVQMAEDISGGVDMQDVTNPNANSTNAERAWHHLLPGYTSGYMYYGSSIDMEVKQTIAGNLAMSFANPVINSYFGPDLTAPNVFIPQRWPYNPGGEAFGPTAGYQVRQNSTDCTIWTFAYDVSGMQSVQLKYRVDFDGENPLTDNENDIYAGGSGVSNWMSMNMTQRVFPSGNVTNNPEISFFELPDVIADEYYATISGLSDTLVDYYVEATDNAGNVFKTPIQHVYIGGNSGTTPQGLYWTPQNPTLSDVIEIVVTNQNIGARLHWGLRENGNDWTQPLNGYFPANTVLFNGIGPAVQSDMNGPNQNDELRIQIGPFNDPAQVPDGVNFVLNYVDNTWDNNNGQDYYIPITPTLVGVEENKSDLATIFPNPTTGNVVFQIANGNHQQLNLEVWDEAGRLVHKQNAIHNQRIDFGFLDTGIYVVRVADQDGKLFEIERLVKL